MEFKDKLTIQRKQNNYSQEQLADMIGVSRQSVSKWETGESYPDMAKIIQLCKILNCELTDLLDDGVITSTNIETSDISKQSKGKAIVDYFNGFLEFVTKAYNMFINMTLKSKLIMLIELLFLGLVLAGICAVLVMGLNEFLRPLVYLLPYNIAYAIYNLVSRLIAGIVVGVGIVVFVHLFKIRYLDYYVTITDNKAIEQTVEEPIDENKNNSELIKSSNPKIIIRDPKHSGSRFIEFLANVVIILFKIFIVICVLPAIISFVFFVAASVFSIVNISKGNGLVFLYSLFVFIGCCALCLMIVLFTYNLVANRKQRLKVLLSVMIAGLVLIGVGTGLTVNKISTFSNNVVNYKTEYAQLENIKEKTYLQFWTSDVEYIIDDETLGIKIEATVPEGYRFVASSIDAEAEIEEEKIIKHYYNFYSYLDYDNMFEAISTLTTHLKEGSLIDFNDSYNLGSVKVILSKETFDKLSIDN